jgi:hypothetical protein
MSDAIAGRARAIEQTVCVKEQRAQGIATAQRAVDTATQARKAECAPIRGPRCRDPEANGADDTRRAQRCRRDPVAATLSISATDP